MIINDDQKKSLLSIARQAILSALGGERFISSSGTPEGIACLVTPAFVTLTKRSILRGCIGQICSEDPLGKLIPRMACEAAFHDPRFPPVRLEELPDLEVEISLLTPLQLVEDIEDISPGQDGLVIEGNGRKGLLLPQVASKYGWDSKTFLDQTCHKAGLPRNAWQDPLVKIWRFQATVFSEKDFSST